MAAERTDAHLSRTAILPNNLLVEGPAASRSTKRLQFVTAFDAAREQSWLELCKHVVAMANSGGGVINVAGGVDVVGPLTELLTRHTGAPFRGLEYRVEQQNGSSVGSLVIAPREGAPLLFEKAAQYTDEDGTPHTAFERGTVYFRHGSKSEPANAKDMARFVNRQIDRERRAVQRNVRKATGAPKGAEVLVVSPRQPSLFPSVRVVEDPDAPVVARADFDVTHPYRQKELVAAVNARIEGARITAYDVQCVRRVHHVNERPEFFHQPKFGSPQYSEAYVAWLAAEYARDPEFFADAKHRDQERRRRTDGSRPAADS
jgi:hypothetical protein